MTQKIVLACLLFGFSFLAKADLLNISCNSAAGGVTSSGSEQCSSGGITGTTASAVDAGAADYFVTAQNNALSGVVESGALIAGDLTLLVGGGTGTARLVPCLSATETLNGGAAASFCNVVLNGNGDTCNAPVLSDGIQITFGNPVSGIFTTTADAEPGGFSQASFQWFEVINGADQVISTAVGMSVP